MVTGRGERHQVVIAILVPMATLVFGVLTATADSVVLATTSTSTASVVTITGGARASAKAVRMPMNIPLAPPTGTPPSQPPPSQPPPSQPPPSQPPPSQPPPSQPPPSQPPPVEPRPVAPLLFPLDPSVRCAVLNNFGQQRGGYVHEGEDIAAAEGTAVLAVVDGTLAKQYVAGTPTTQLSGNGWRLVSSADQAYYFYAHLQAVNPALAVGSVVRRGDLLGWVGHTGDAGAGNDHLHLEVHPTGLTSEVVDPLPLLDVPATCTVYPPQR